MTDLTRLPLKTSHIAYTSQTKQAIASQIYRWLGKFNQYEMQDRTISRKRSLSDISVYHPISIPYYFSDKLLKPALYKPPRLCGTFPKRCLSTCVNYKFYYITIPLQARARARLRAFNDNLFIN